MRSIHVLRKPCSEGTVAANVLKYGTGALNIDAARIGFASEADEAESKTKNQHADFDSAPVTGNVIYGDYSMMAPKNYNPPGRWPANLILQHLDGCKQDGVKKVPGHKGYPHGPGGVSMHYASDARSADVRPNAWKGHASEDGTETIPAWSCAPGCPVAALDAQSGQSQSASGVVKYVRAETSGWKERGGSFTPGHTWEAQAYGDTGGASRFFRQIGGASTSATPHLPTPGDPVPPGGRRGDG